MHEFDLARKSPQSPFPPLAGADETSHTLADGGGGGGGGGGGDCGQVKVQIFPPSWTAANLVPSLEEVMLLQSFALPIEVSSVQVAPESAEVQIEPLKEELTAASLAPSLEEVTPHQYFVLPTEVSLVQVSPESVEVQM